jgi:hypothetical protein
MRAIHDVPHRAGAECPVTGGLPFSAGLLVSRRPERRRYRSDAELRGDRARWERQWNEQREAVSTRAV